MSQIVHVIKPSGTAFQYTFSDATTPEEILSQLAAIKGQFGFNGTVKKRDPNPNMPEGAPLVDFQDVTSGFAYDHPNTVVVILKTEKVGTQVTVVHDEAGKPVELKRLKGTPPTKEETPSVETPQTVPPSTTP